MFWAGLFVGLLLGLTAGTIMVVWIANKAMMR